MADRLLDKRVHFNLWYFVLALMLLIVLRETIMQSQVATIPYSEFLSQLDAGEVIRVVVSDTEIRGERETPIDGKTLFETTRIEPDFAAQLYEHEVEVTGTIQRGLMVALAAWFLPLTLLLALIALVLCRLLWRVGGRSARWRGRRPPGCSARCRDRSIEYHRFRGK